MKPPTKPPSQRNPATRWTPKLAERWTPISDAFLEYYTELEPPITSLEAVLIVHLVHHKWGAEAPYPAFKTLAKKMGMTPTAVRNHARNLEKKGYLWREKRVSTTNRFHLDGLFQKLEKHLAGKPARPKRSKSDTDLDAFAA